MRVNFKFKCQLGSVVYTPGVHDVPDEYEKHWFMLACFQNGKAEMVKDKAPRKAGSKMEIPSMAPQKPMEETAVMKSEVSPSGKSFSDHLKQKDASSSSETKQQRKTRVAREKRQAARAEEASVQQ